MSVSDPGSDLPDIWLRSFYGFDPENDGYVGWTEERHRDRILELVAPGDLMLIYGANTADTPAEGRGRCLGLLQVEPEPVMDIDRSSELGLSRKRERGWEGRWCHGIPVRRAWRFDEGLRIDQIASETYSPEKGRGIAAWSARLTPNEVEAVMRVRATEVPVFGEPPPAPDAITGELVGEAFRPSRGLNPTFGTRTSKHHDGKHWLYVMHYEGDAAAFLGWPNARVGKRSLIKVGFSNELKRRLAELNSGIPPAAHSRWHIPHTSPPLPNGDVAKEAEDKLKAYFDKKGESLGGEFFLIDDSEILPGLIDAAGSRRLSMKA
jgi:hypothetical protein